MIRALRLGIWALACLAGGAASFVVVFVLAAWFGSAIPRGEAFERIDRPVTIMVESNGLHTQLVLPIEHPIKDWREVFPNANEPVGGFPATHISIGFGEREVFLNTPDWNDLELLTGLRVIGFGGDAMIRVTPYLNPAQSDFRSSVKITREQYRALVAGILADLPELEPRGFRPFERADYAPQDAYYASARRYGPLTTCNQWTSDRLADAGIRTGWWTPLPHGVMRWVPPYSTDLSVD